MSKALTLSVRPRGRPVKKLPEETSIDINASGSDLYQSLARQAGFSVHRLRITKGSDGSLVPNSKDVTVSLTGLRDQSTVYVKDLGPQIAWRTVFIVEYLGPLLIHPLIYLLRPYLYADPPASPSSVQTLSFALICAHFAKREIETLFVHRFSSATMPLMNIFKNSFHYWVLAGANVAYWIYRPDALIANPPNPLLTYAALALYTVGELGNYFTHLTLRNLRSSGSTERGIPQGFTFNLVTCPNYMFETVAWLGMCLMTLSWSTVLFAAVSVGQMMPWAKKKEANLRREFGDKYKKKRFAMLPGIW